jgi:hypothetical protein
VAIRLEDLLTSFRRHLRAAAKAPRTIELSRQSVRHRGRWLDAHGRPQTLDELTRHAISGTRRTHPLHDDLGNSCPCAPATAGGPVTSVSSSRCISLGAGAVDEHHSAGPCAGRADQVDDHRSESLRPDGTGAGKSWCSPLAPYETTCATHTG